MIHVLIVDDHEVVRTGIRHVLDTAPGIKVVGEAPSGEEAIRIVREKKVDVILMDLKMPGIGGLETTKKLRRQYPDIKIIALTVQSDEPFPMRLLQAGASGYITKDSPLEEVVKAIKTVFMGKKTRYMSSNIAQQLALKHVSEENESPFTHLSERELQVMMMIVSAKKVSEISDLLCLSPKTVNSYRYRLFEKLQVASDVELTHLALRHGIITHEDALG